MAYATKLLVIVSMAGAIALETRVTAGLWPALLPLTIAAFVVAAAVSVVYDEGCAAACRPGAFSRLDRKLFGDAEFSGVAISKPWA